MAEFPPVTVVDACLRTGDGPHSGPSGSPTAVLVDDAALADDVRRSIPGRFGTSHAVFVARGRDGHVALRFFTSAGELPACGHGTVAALAFLGATGPAGTDRDLDLRTATRRFSGRVARSGDGWSAAFDAGPVELHDAGPREHDDVLTALGLDRGPDRRLDHGLDLGETSNVPRIASIGRRRILVPVRDEVTLAALAPDFDELRDACDTAGLLGCYVYSPPSPAGRLAARMFAPSIGVPEDIANANSTACLAAHLAAGGGGFRGAGSVGAGGAPTSITVDMGDGLGVPATITAEARTAAIEAAGVRYTVHIGGMAVVRTARTGS